MGLYGELYRISTINLPRSAYFSDVFLPGSASSHLYRQRLALAGVPRSRYLQVRDPLVFRPYHLFSIIDPLLPCHQLHPELPL